MPEQGTPTWDTRCNKLLTTSCVQVVAAYMLLALFNKRCAGLHVFL